MSQLYSSQLSQSPVDEQVGNQLRFCRTRAGLSIAQLAGTLGVRPEEVERWEQGLTRMPAEQVIASTKVLVASLSELFSDQHAELEPVGQAASVNGQPRYL